MVQSSPTSPWYDQRPLVALAPMEAITDTAFRPLVRTVAPSVVLFTEFAPARGLLAGAERVWKMVEFTEQERPLVVQLYDNDAPSLGLAAGEVVARHRPDGLDLNMGCPVRKVAGRGAGCGMMADPENAALSVRRMVEHADGVPVTVKTRLGIRDKSEVVEVAHAVLEAGARAITIHARLKADRPRVPADWASLASAQERIVAEHDVPVLGNGDVWTEEDAVRMVEQAGVEGVMVARGAIGNPWMLHRCAQALAGEEVAPLPTREQKAEFAIRHLQANIRDKGERRGVLELRKVVRHYIKGYLDSRQTWHRLIETESELETARILEEFGRRSDDLRVLDT